MVKVVKVKMVKMNFQLRFELTIIINIYIYYYSGTFFNPKTILTK